MTVLCYSKAFDCARREVPLTWAIGKRIPITYTHWLRDFLSNNKAKVETNGDRGRQLPLRKELPLSVVIDGFRRAVTENIEVAWFVGDVIFLWLLP